MWICDEGLLDLGFNGPQFTWMTGSSKDTYRGAKLDRALSNTLWRNKFEKATIYHLPRLQSNHSPILVSMEGTKKLNIDRPFRVQAARFHMKIYVR